jgi:hypothetical protein
MRVLSYCSTLPPGTNSFAVTINNNNNNNNNNNQEIPRTGERNTRYVEAGRSTRGPDSNFSHGNNSKVTVTKSKET